MADTLLVNPIIAVVSFGRGAVSSEKKETGGNHESRASLCVEALEMCLHRQELCAWKRTLPVAHLYQCGGLDADTLLNAPSWSVWFKCGQYITRGWGSSQTGGHT